MGRNPSSSFILSEAKDLLSGFPGPAAQVPRYARDEVHPFLRGSLIPIAQNKSGPHSP